MSKTLPGRNEPKQIDKFRDLARQLECDEDEARFEDQVRKIASAPKPEPGQKP